MLHDCYINGSKAKQSRNQNNFTLDLLLRLKYIRWSKVHGGQAGQSVSCHGSTDIRVKGALEKGKSFLVHVKEIRFDDFTRYPRSLFRGGEWK